MTSCRRDLDYHRENVHREKSWAKTDGEGPKLKGPKEELHKIIARETKQQYIERKTALDHFESLS
jgi:hypothetical protein